MLVARSSSVGNVITGCHNKDVTMVLPTLKNIECHPPRSHTMQMGKWHWPNLFAICMEH